MSSVIPSVSSYFLSFFSEAKPRLTKETAVELGMFSFVLRFCFCPFLLLTNTLADGTNRGAGREPLHRRLDVYKLEPEPPLDTLPFISHTTNNISRDFCIGDSEFCFVFHLFFGGGRVGEVLPV